MTMKKINQEFLNRELQTIINKKNVFSAVLRVESGDNNFSWTGATGDMQADSPYFIASVTKLYITVVVMHIIDEQRLSLDDSIAKYLPEEELRGLHVIKGVEYSHQITIRHLISNSSGLPDYFFHKQPDGQTAASKILEGIDQSWPVEQTISTVKQLKPNFPPGKKGKAAYSDTNYQILGKIIETVTGKTMSEVFKAYIFDALDLRHTYTYQDVNDNAPVPFYYQAKKLWLPNYVASISAEGGIVSTAEEVMIFLKAFFQGSFFPAERIEQMKRWNVILPPPGLFLFGVGLEKIWTPWFISPFKPIKEILGFWGQAGSFAWYNPDTDLYFCGTTNQIDGSGHAAAANAIVKIIKAEL
jgi:CubicO group peptidase (beta-lactamase class C family)